ncbi:hypothetical protein SAMN04488008_10993 [Maribacter orientalis]|uniref:Uncharacterized protein n=1 Tax=Maribacter orientalis TaxID=228957 RepID=A0A1H7VPD5_9FLAO|nr:hypothetical protein SAMN04488008_10993 [Maribacter orientalis]
MSYDRIDQANILMTIKADPYDTIGFFYYATFYIGIILFWLPKSEVG